LKPETVVAHVNVPEGPVWCDDGTLVFTSVPDGAVYRVKVETGERTTVAIVGGGANSAAPTTDGGFAVTQNGGYDWGALGMNVEDVPPYVPATPGLQYVAPDGSVRYLYDEGFRAPNDLTVTEDGTLYFTDPPHYPGPPEPVGRVHAVTTDGNISVVADGFHYCNGIAREPGGTFVVVEPQGLMRLALDGSRDWIVQQLGTAGGDGLALDADGHIYACAAADHAVWVFDRDGAELDRLQLPGPGMVTNCCFGGADGRTLFVTEAQPGSVVAFEGLPTPGLPVLAWRVPARA
jgi:gluconolactonase